MHYTKRLDKALKQSKYGDTSRYYTLIKSILPIHFIKLKCKITFSFSQGTFAGRNAVVGKEVLCYLPFSFFSASWKNILVQIMNSPFYGFFIGKRFEFLFNIFLLMRRTVISCTFIFVF